jgi:NAD(P)-dependent dehydrogenase (short-subunit alcohol dehydrogenase family)
VPPKRVLITGGSKGIGLDVAARLAAGWHRPVRVARKSPSEYPGAFFAADLADPDEAERLLAQILRAGPVDA